MVTRSRLARMATLAVAGVVIVGAAALAIARVGASRRERLTARAAAGSGVFVHAADVYIHLQVEGPLNGPPVLLVHGTGAWSEIWRETMHSLGEAGYRAIAIDLPPFGYSERPESAKYTDDAQARRILAVLDAMKIERVTLVGHSFSARPTIEATFIAPERVSSLVLVDAALDIDPPAPKPTSPVTRSLLHNRVAREAVVSATLTNPRFTRRLLLKLISNRRAATPERVAMLQQPFALEGTTAAYGAWLEPFVTKRERSRSTESVRYRGLSMPTLVIWGARDAVTPVAQGRRLAELIPNARLEVLATAGHIPAIEASEEFNAALLAFLAETVPLSTRPVF